MNVQKCLDRITRIKSRAEQQDEDFRLCAEIDIPYLIEEIERLQGQVNRMRIAWAKFTSRCPDGVDHGDWFDDVESIGAAFKDHAARDIAHTSGATNSTACRTEHPSSDATASPTT